jgi:transcription initiation factor IIF auxiliary subunit
LQIPQRGQIQQIMLPQDTLIKIIARNTSERIVAHPGGKELFYWSVFIETEPKSFRKEIREVTYHLHPTFPDKDVAIANEKQGFKFTAQGWGEFSILIDITLKDGRKTALSHYLSLFSEEKKKETTKTLYKMDFL